jgi:alpha-glucosidase (family GH31 glycosyl hydrolase)
MCNPDDREYLDRKLKRLMDDYGIDGFKLDGGNISTYDPDRIVNGRQSRYTAAELNIAWNEFGARYEYHEYKDTFKGGGKPVVQRIRDRHHCWDGEGLSSLIPAALLQGLLGYPFLCPDMVGGGEWSFNYLPGFRCDEELFVRMAECSALMPMIQLSWAPHRMLDDEHAALCLSATRLHARFSPEILAIAEVSAVTGEPILRHMEYVFPHAGYEWVCDQFLLGDEILVAPVLTKGATERTVLLPEGEWYYLGETHYTGKTHVTVPAPLGTLPYFTRTPH